MNQLIYLLFCVVLINDLIQCDLLIRTSDNIVRSAIQSDWIDERTGEASTSYVELGMVADYLFYQRAKEHLQTDDAQMVASFVVAYFVQLAELASQTFERSLPNLTVVLKFVYILTSDSVSPFSSNALRFEMNGNAKDSAGRFYLKFDDYLGAFNTWVSTNLNSELSSFDTIVAVTGGNLAHGSMESISGVAQMEGACSTNRRGFVIEDQFDFTSFTNLAHELAHCLGKKMFYI